jgi:hypothetical protein
MSRGDWLGYRGYTVLLTHNPPVLQYSSTEIRSRRTVDGANIDLSEGNFRENHWVNCWQDLVK